AEHDGGYGERRRRRAAAGVPEPYQHSVQVCGGVARLLHERPRVHTHPPPRLLQLRRRMCESMVAVERRLKELGIPYIQRCVEEDGIYVDQIFFHDPDGFMIEICNCDKLPVVPLADQTFAMAACKRAASVKQQQLPMPDCQWRK
ncbi:hypothetical protein CFC21_010858, partial [Triticum aestivum]